jgi:tetratricopeptide (TPR) repeat protein
MMRSLLLTGLLVTSGYAFDNDAMVDNGSIMEMDSTQSRQGKFKKKFRNKFMNKGGIGQKMKQQMASFMASLPEQDKETAGKIMGYLHATNQVVSQYRQNKNYDKALEILNKRLRLVIPQNILDKAPEFLKSYKAATRMEIGNFYAQMGKPAQGVPYLEQALSEATSNNWNFLKSKIQKDLAHVYKKAGMENKSFEMLESQVKELETGLTFQ